MILPPRSLDASRRAYLGRAREPRPGDCQDGGRGHRQPPARAALEADALTPLAVQLDALGWFGLVEFLAFVAILGVAYVYIWRKGALNWH